MATWVIGDVQGCMEPLERLLLAVDFNPRRDRVCLLGDLVNRGPDSLAVLRWGQGMGDRLVALLGNHDLHLLARAAGVTTAGARDTLDEVLAAPDAASLLAWLRHRPLLVREQGLLLVHAGLLPAWSQGEALARAAEVEAALRGPGYKAFLGRLHDRSANFGAVSVPDRDRVLRQAALLTRLRVCAADGSATLTFTGQTQDCPAGTRPWFQWPTARLGTVVFGHWAALGAARGANWVALDSGCVWGRALTALRLEDGATVSVPAAPNPCATPAPGAPQ